MTCWGQILRGKWTLRAQDSTVFVMIDEGANRGLANSVGLEGPGLSSPTLLVFPTFPKKVRLPLAKETSGDWAEPCKCPYLYNKRTVSLEPCTL